MAKYTILHACGHTSQRTLWGREVDRQKILKQRAAENCPRCYGEAQKALGPCFTVRIAGPGPNHPLLPNGHKIRRIEVIAYRATYEIRDELKVRGYKFQEAFNLGGFGLGDLMISARGLNDPQSVPKGSPGWSKLIDPWPGTPADIQRAIEAMNLELIWAGQHGWEIIQRKRERGDNLADSFLEGREDLLEAV
jgi:hypothetical protein